MAVHVLRRGVRRFKLGDSGTSVLHPTALDWGTRVVTNGGATPSNATLVALSSFCYGLDGNGLTSLMLAVNPIAPDSLIAATTPLFKVLGSDPWVNHGFVLADLTVNGILGNGTSKYYDPGVTPTALQALTSSNYGFGSYRYTGNNLAEMDWGTQNGVVLYDLQTFTDNKTYADLSYAGGNGRVSATNSNWTGYIFASRTSTTALSLYKANSGTAHTSIASSSTATSPENLAQNIFAMANNNAGTPNSWSSKRISALFLTKGLSSTQSSAYYSLWQQLRTDLGGGFV